MAQARCWFESAIAPGVPVRPFEASLSRAAQEYPAA